MKLSVLIYTIHPTNNIYVRIYMQYIQRIMKTNMRLHHSIQHNKMVCRLLGLSTFWCVDVLTCRRFGLSTFWCVDVLVCRRFGLSTFWFVDVSVCRRIGLSTFRFVDVLVVDVSVCRRFDQLPPRSHHRLSLYPVFHGCGTNVCSKLHFPLYVLMPLTHCGLVMPNAPYNWIDSGSKAPSRT